MSVKKEKSRRELQFMGAVTTLRIRAALAPSARS
jgi:hypothetical protein